MEHTITTPNRLDWERLRAWAKNASRKPCPRCAGSGKIASAITCPTCLGDSTLRRDIRPMISEGKLLRIAGLLRIRDDYEPVWRLAEDETGTSYIVRIGGDDGEDDRIYVANNKPEARSMQAATKLTILTQEEAASRYGKWAAVQMRELGVTKARTDLLERWASHRKTANPALLNQATPGSGSQGPGMGNANSGVTAGPTGQNATEMVRGWECPHCHQQIGGGIEFQEHLRNEHGIVDGD